MKFSPLAPALALALAWGSPFVFAQTLRTVMHTGRPADSGGAAPMTFTEAGAPSINDSGEVALSAFAMEEGQPERGGVWSEGGGEGLRLVALNNTAMPGITGGLYNGLELSYPSINNAGQTAFRAWSPLATGITNSNNSGAYVATPGQTPTLVLREGEAAPGAPAGAIFSDLNDVVRQRYSPFNELGQISGVDWLRLNVGGIGSNSESGVWFFGSGLTPSLVGRESGVAAGISPTRYYGNIAAVPNLNDIGQITFATTLRTTQFATTSAGAGIWMRQSDGSVTLLARDGQSAPGVPGATYGTSLIRPALNNAGDYAFSAAMAVAGSVTDANNGGLWIARDGAPLALFVREDQQAPGVDPGIGFSTFSDLILDSQGRAAFRASLKGITGAGPVDVTTANDTGIWAEGDSGLVLVAREGSQAAELAAGALYSTFLGPTTNAAGRVAFSSTLTGAGVTTSNDVAIFAQDADGIVRLIVREGDALDVDDSAGVDLRTVSQVAFFTDGGPEDGTRSGFNAAGQLAFLATFTDGTSGVFVSNLVADLAESLAGDFNEDEYVNDQDLAAWRLSFGAAGSATHAQGDADGDHDVDGADFLVWQRQFGSGPQSQPAVLSVPEPSAWSLLTAALALQPWLRITRRTG